MNGERAYEWHPYTSRIVEDKKHRIIHKPVRVPNILHVLLIHTQLQAKLDVPDRNRKYLLDV